MQVGYVLLQIILLGQGGTRNPKIFCTALKALIQYNQSEKLDKFVPK